MMSKYALINDSGEVINTVIWDGEGDIFGKTLVVSLDDEEAGIGWTYKNGKFTPPDYDGNLSGG